MKPQWLTICGLAAVFAVNSTSAVESESLLADAVEKKERAVARALLEQRVDVNARQADGMTALHWAVYHDDLETAKLLVAADADVTAENRYGVPPLSIACKSGNTAIVELLLAADADPNATLRGGETALMTAARTGRLGPVKALLAHGADVNTKERKGQTALMWAAADGHVAVVDALIEAGADFRTALESGFTPLFFAVRAGRTDVVFRLLQAGVDVNKIMEPQKTSGKGPRAGTSPLVLAVANGHFDLAAALLEAGANPNDKRCGFTALHAITSVRKPIRGDGDPPPIGSGKLSSLEFVRKLAAHGADVNARHRKQNAGNGRLNRTDATPFLLAAETADVPLMRLLVELGADPLLPNADNCTPLLAAAGVGVLSNGDEAAGSEAETIEAIKLLLELGADINAVDDHGKSAMHGAAFKSRAKLVQFLADHGADINVWNRKNNRGWTPLLIAQGHRPGNFRPSPETIVAVERVMRAAGVEPPAERTRRDSKVDFSRQIRPILASKCFNCHGPDPQQRKGDLRLDFAAGARPAIVSSDAEKSELIQRITSKDPDARMPPEDAKARLSADEISLLIKWVSQGADYSVHWSFDKLQRPETPARDKEWGRNEIDAFVLKRLAAAELRPSSETDKVTLIRRLSLDLTGLPPTIGEVDRYLADTQPAAYERLVDRLLAAPQYGERMAQDWLDLARYGDTNGYESDSDRQMWLYRDWVIDAFNANMPFDQFTREQIAGDLMPAASPSQKIASGFNRNTTYNEEGGADGEEFMVVYAVERASTTATVFLGLTLGCAQCHEHKYDPISQKEFYQFYAFFNSVEGEKGATGHDIPLPPLLSLPTKEQTVILDRTRKELAKVEARIKDELATVAIVAVPAPRQSGSASSSVPDGVGKEQATTEQQPYFNTQVAWEQHEKEKEKSELPKEILQLVKLDPQKRNDEQRTQLRDYFVQHAYAPSRRTFEPLNRRRDELKKRADETGKSIPTTMVMKEMAERRPAYLLIRGDFQQKDEQVDPSVPAIFPPLPTDQPRNRLGLAHWLTDANNPLVARVAVNRLWKQLFGAGLVSTMEDFGVRGEYPSHPELLDWLAAEFLRTDWDVKALQKRIVMSSTYRQSSRYRPDAAKVDPYNRLLARQNRFRLTGEEIRDTALAVSGLLHKELGGRSVFPYQPQGYYSDKGRWKWNQSKGADLYRRGLYTFWRRTTTYPTFSIFDAPSRETCTVERPRTNTPLQALVTLNDPMFVEAARVLGARILREGGDSIDAKVGFAFRATLARGPDGPDRAILAKIYTDQFAKYSADSEAAAALVRQGEYPSPEHVDPAELAAWTTAANVLLNLDETVTRE